MKLLQRNQGSYSDMTYSQKAMLFFPSGLLDQPWLAFQHNAEDDQGNRSYQHPPDASPTIWKAVHGFVHCLSMAWRCETGPAFGSLALAPLKPSGREAFMSLPVNPSAATC